MSDDTRTLNGGMHDASATPKLPFFKLYTRDYRADPGLRAVSFAARGLWVDLLTLLHESDVYGVLVVRGEPLTPERIAPRVGGSVAEVTGLLAELEREGVFSRRDDGAIYCRRMIRDAERAARDRANGLKGGNPRLRVIHGGRSPGGGSGGASGQGSGAGGGGSAEGPAAGSAAGVGVKGGVKARARAARGQSLDRFPLTPPPDGGGEPRTQAQAEEGRPAGWSGQWAGTRVSGTNPRALAAAEAAAVPEPSGPLWEACRGHVSPAEFRAWLGAAVLHVADGVARIIAPTAARRTMLRERFGDVLPRALGLRVEFVVAS